MICLTYLLWYLEMQIVLVLFGLEASSSKKRGQTISFMAPEALIRLICLFSPLDFHWICSALPRYFQYLTFKNLFLTTLVYSITPTGIRNEVQWWNPHGKKQLMVEEKRTFQEKNQLLFCQTLGEPIKWSTSSTNRRIRGSRNFNLKRRYETNHKSHKGSCVFLSGL